MKAAAVYALLLWLCTPAFANDWQTIRNCRLIENESNDGDSFHVKADGEERIFRLYFVDTPSIFGLAGLCRTHRIAAWRSSPSLS